MQRKSIWKMTADSVFMFGPFKFIGGLVTIAMQKVLLTYIGAQAYGTPLGNLKIAGITLLGCIVAGTFVALGQRLFKIEEGEATNKTFWPILIVMLLSFVSFIIFSFRSLLMLVGLIQQGSSPPSYLEWMFKAMEYFN